MSERFEQLVVERGPRSGATLVIAVHSTRLGPALGGARMWHYRSEAAAVADAKALGAAMTLKAAVAGLELGGGKGVLATPSPQAPSGALRQAMLEDFGDLVESLEGAYITAEDVGTGTADMEVIATRTDRVVGRTGGSGDPSPVTALGVLSAIRACARRHPHRSGGGLGGLHACIIGLGHVGTSLASQLDAEGARLTVTDIDPRKRELADALGAEWSEPEEALETACDVLAPCALGGAITPTLVPRLRAPIVCGAANNILSDRSVAGLLERRGIIYAPDFVANAGGLISVYGELRSLPRSRALELARGIEGTTERLLGLAKRAGEPTVTAAERLAAERLRRGARQGASGSPAAAFATLEDC